MTEIVRVLRVLQYIGTREWVEATVRQSVHGRKEVCLGCYIEGTTITPFPEYINPEAT